MDTKDSQVEKTPAENPASQSATVEPGAEIAAAESAAIKADLGQEQAADEAAVATSIKDAAAPAAEKTALPADTEAADEAAVADAVKDSAAPAAEKTALPADTEAADEAAVADAVKDSAPIAAEKTALPDAGEDPEAAAEDEVTSALKTVDEVMEAARKLLERPAAEISRDEISRLRLQYANLTKGTAEANAEEGSEPAEPKETETDLEFKNILTQIKDKKAAYTAELEAKRAANLARKNAIIEEIIALAGDTDNVNRTFPRYRELQDEFNALGEVPATEETGVWKRFQDAREQFSDNLRVNKELRDYDFKKNLEQKELIITEAATLNAEPDIITAFRRLQELHNKWREIGPVAKELRDEVWNRFKEASLEVNKRYQAFFEERKAREAENEAGKTAICERVEALDFSNLKSFSAWDKMTETIKQAQEDWKKFGFASRKMNNALFQRFRAVCDTFFALKADYFKSMKEELAQNLAKKTALVEKAESLKDSTDWKNTTDELVALQKEWKTIGTVSKKYSDAIWHRFQAACDHFFEQKKAATSGARQTEQANLQAKKDLIKELDKITDETPKSEAQDLINDLMERWKSIGHVPFREKDKVYEAFRARINEVRDKFNLAVRRERQERFARDVESMEGDDNKMLRERERQLRLLETRRAELRTYENNLGFLSAKSKTGNSLVKDFERKIENLKADIAQLEDRIRLLDAKM